MKYAPTVAGILLGLLFLMASITMLFGLGPKPPEPPPGSAPALFMGAFAPTGYLTFVKVLELLGGILVAIPKTRNFGLLILGPIVVNIVAFHVFIAKGGYENPLFLLAVVLPLYLLWVERKKFAGLLR